MSSVTQAHAGAGRALTLSRCALLVISGDQKGQQRVLDGDLLRIGKNADLELVLTDGTVSREHCEIMRDPKGYLLRDLRVDQRHVARRRRDPGGVYLARAR